MKALITNGEDWVTLAATRNLGKHGVNVTVASHRKKAMTFHSKYCKDRVIYPDTRKVGHEISNYLLSFVKKEKFDVLLPGQENIIIPVAKDLEKFRPYVNVPIPDFEIIDRADDKSKAYRKAEKSGIRIPRTLYMEDLDDPERAVKDLNFPVLIKPYRGAGSKGHAKISSRRNLGRIFMETVKRYGPSMIQEYVDGVKFSTSAIMDKKTQTVETLHAKVSATLSSYRWSHVFHGNCPQ